MGVGRFLRRKDPEVQIHPLEPASSPTLSTGCKVGKHRIRGISDEFIPPIVDLGYQSPVVAVDDGDALRLAQRPAGELGLGVGISSGASLLGALMAQDELGGDAVVVTVFPDDNKKYLSTDLMKELPASPDSPVDRIRLLGFRAFKRVCHTCCDPDDCTQLLAASDEDDGPLPTCPRRP